MLKASVNQLATIISNDNPSPPPLCQYIALYMKQSQTDQSH